MGKQVVLQIFAITGSTLRQERRNIRVIMGYLLGLAVLCRYISDFFRYAQDAGEPINVLETFVVAEQDSMNLMFLALGWLLVLAGAPFVKGNAAYVLYRSSRRRWNMGSLLYILLQAFFFVSCMAAVTVLAGSFIGFPGDIWSSPVYELAMDRGNHLGVKYGVTFPWGMMMKSMTVPQAFGITFLLMYLYFAFLGVLLYTCSLLLHRVWGMAVVFGVHFLGYLFKAEGYQHLKYSLLACAIPGYLADSAFGYWKSVCLYIALIVLLLGVTSLFVKRVDFAERTEVEG